ncbi:MAG: GspH/FimT family pseudopilin [Pseudomonadota bacterium]
MSRAMSRAGFTLIELCVVLLLAAILLAIAAPNLTTAIHRQQLKTATDDLYRALALTRSAALERGTRVELAPLDPDGRNWSAGWSVFVDANGNQRPDPGEEVIARHGPVATGIAIRSAMSSQAQPDYLAYNGAGRACSAAAALAPRFGSVSLSYEGQLRRITINMLGRARVCDPARDGAACGGAGAD